MGELGGELEVVVVSYRQEMGGCVDRGENGSQ